MTEDAPKKRSLISKRLAAAFRDVLKEVGRPVEISELGVMAAERGHHRRHSKGQDVTPRSPACNLNSPNLTT
jgi:hypothetical protein